MRGDECNEKKLNIRGCSQTKRQEGYRVQRIFTVKYKADRTIHKYKVRLVAKRYAHSYRTMRKHLL